MTLDDLLVSYKLVNAPKAKPINFEEPSRFDLFRQSRLLEQLLEQLLTQDFLFPGWLETVFQSNTSTKKLIPWNEILQNLVEAYMRLGITNRRALRMLVALDALESGYGKSILGTNNYGNITTGSSWNGNYITGRDKDANGKPITLRFRSYNSLDDYVADKVKLLKNSYDFSLDDNLETFIKKLTGENHKSYKYAQDKDYGVKIRNNFLNINV